MSDESREIIPSSGPLPAVPAAQQGIHRRAIQQPQATASVQSVTGVLSDIGDNVVTSGAERILDTSDENMVWQERPSPVLLIPRFLKYAVVMVIVMMIFSVIDRYAGPWLERVAESQGAKLGSTLVDHDTRMSQTRKNAKRARLKAAQTQADNATDTDTDDVRVIRRHQARVLVDIQWIIAGVLFLLWITYLVRLLTTRYSASSQRLIVEEGILHSENRPYELHQLGDAVITKPLIPRLFGVGNLQIVVPPVKLIGLRNPEYVRDLIRQGGQLEAQRVDKVRFR